MKLKLLPLALAFATAPAFAAMGTTEIPPSLARPPLPKLPRTPRPPPPRPGWHA